MIQKTTTFLLLFLMPIFILGQVDKPFPVLNFKNITTTERLTNKLINAIIQDKNGLIWVGTEDGLNRLDGYRTKQFYHNALNNKSLVNDAIKSIYALDANTMYIGTGYGLSIFNFSKNEISTIDSSLNKNIGNDGIISFLYHHNNLWVMGSSNYFSINALGNITQYNYEPNENNENNYYANITKDVYNNIWAVKGNCVYTLDTNSLSAIKEICFGPNERKKQLTITTYNEYLYIATIGNGLWLYNTQTKTQTKINLKSKNAVDPKVYTDNHNNKWIICGVDNGYALINPLNKKVVEFPLGATITNTFIDNENGIWLGSAEGLFYARNPNPYIFNFIFADIAKNLPTAVSEKFGLPGKVSKTNDYYYVPLVYGNGLLTFHKNWTYKSYTPKVLTQNNDDRLKYIGNVIKHNNSTWVATRAGLAKCQENFNAEKIFLPNLINPISSNALKMKDLYELTDSTILIKSFSGIFIFNTKKEQFEKLFYANSLGQYNELNCFIAEVAIDSKQICYLATENGLLKLDLTTAQITPVPLSQNTWRLSCIQLKKNILWIGSQTGLCSYNIDTKETKTYFRNDGLNSDNILYLQQGRANKLWVSTTNGLCCFDTETFKTINIYEKDGIPEIFLQGELFVDDEGNVALGNSKGMSIINKAIANNTNLQKASFITEINVNNLPANFVLKNGNKSIILNENENNISIYFTVANAINNENYYYKLNDIWYTSNSGLIQLSSLSAGTYTIAVSNAPIDSAQNDSITIKIKPAFYSTWWFYLLCALILSALLYAFYSIRISHVKKDANLEKTYQQKLAESEMQTLRSQMNPHFMFNTLNAINSYIIQNKTDLASDYLTTFSKLMRSILELSKTETVSLAKEIAALKMYIELEALRLENKFDYEIIIADNIDDDSIKIPSLTIQPFVENAIWHGLNNKMLQGHIIINIFETDAQYLVIQVEDDGIGRKASAALKQEQIKHKSYGIDITMNRVKLLNEANEVIFEELYNKNKEAIGTKVTIKLKT